MGEVKKEYVGRAGAANILGISLNQVDYLRRHGHLEAKRIWSNGNFRFDVDYLQEKAKGK